MANVALRDLIKVHTENRRARELANLHYRSYRGIPTRNESWIKRDVRGTFTYRGVSYTK